MYGRRNDSQYRKSAANISYLLLGALRKESIVHECLHPVVHSLLEQADYPVEKAEYPGIDESYYQDKSVAGYLNAFEEYAVRKLTEDFLLCNYPNEIDEYLRKLAKNN